MFSRWRIGAQKLSRSATGAAKARSLVLLAVVVAFCSYAVAAQQDSSPAVNAPPSNSIPVRVVVRDANGNPVTGLTRSDFRVLDDKESQQLTFFSVGAPSDSRPYTALFFDDYHLAANIAQVRDAAARCIQSALDHGAHIAVYSASGSLHKDFTVGRGALLQAVSRLAPSSSDGGAAGTVSALDQLVQHMAHAPGPQPIVAVVSDGFSTTDGKDQFADAVARALRADIAINVLDTAPSNSAGDDAILSAFARDTGGIFIHSAGDLDASLAQTATVRLPSYLLGFVPASTTPGGKFHALTVELANNPSHFTIQTRAGYFTSTPAANAAAPEKSASEKDQLTQAIFNPQPVGGVPVEFHVELARVQDDRTQVTVIIGVDLHSFRFHKDGGDNLDDLHYMVGIFDEHGNYVAGQEKTITLRLTDPQLREMTSTGATFSVILDAKPGDDQIRVALMDTGSQQLQFSSQPFNVP